MLFVRTSKVRPLALFAPCLALVALLAVGGCGGGGGSAAPAPVYPPTPTFALTTLNNHWLDFTDPDQASVVTRYAFAGTTYTSPSGDSGTYTYTLVNNGVTNQATLQIVSSFQPAVTFNVTFTTTTTGTYTDSVGKSSTFTVTK